MMKKGAKGLFLRYNLENNPEDTMNRDRLKIIASMVIFGSIGIFVRYIPLPSALIACIRGFSGALFIYLYMKIKAIPTDREGVKRNLPVLIASGAAIGINWIFLFEAYRYTSVAVATLCYYMQPVFVILLSPIVVKEKLSAKKLIAVVCSLAGMYFISGLAGGILGGGNGTKGILFGLAAAAFYATVIFLNKKLKDISDYETTLYQLLFAGAAALPYVLLTTDLKALTVTGTGIILLAVVGIIHTGAAYTLYFGSMKNLEAQSIALYSYIDPVCAIVFSFLILGERPDAACIIGAVLILGSTLFGELSFKRRENN